MTNDATQAVAGATLAAKRPHTGAPVRRSTPPLRRISKEDATNHAQQAASPIVLSVIPRKGTFSAHHSELLDEAGFGWIRDMHQYGLPCPDTGREIARLNRIPSVAFGPATRIEAVIDPHTCVYHYDAGSFLVDCLTRFAKAADADICDGAGVSLGASGLNAIAEHINAVMKARSKADRAKRTVRLPNGEVREQGHLSFVHTVIREAGSRKTSHRNVMFDATPLPYFEGRAKGYEMALEVVDYYREHRRVSLPINQILSAALDLVSSGPTDFKRSSKQWVASGFCDGIAALIHAGAQSISREWMQRRISQELVCHAEWSAEREAKKKRRDKPAKAKRTSEITGEAA